MGERSGRRLRAGMGVSALALMVALVASTTAVTAPGDTADLRVTKSDSPDPVTVNSVLTYTIQVTNLGPQGATGTTVTDRLPAGVDFVSATSTQGTCERQGRNVTCEVGALSAGGNNASETITIRVRPTKAGTISNTASADSVENDPVAANNEDTETTQVREAGAAVPTCRGVPATLRGNAGDNTIVGTDGPDVIAAFGGDDEILARGGRDLVCAGRDNDFVNAGTAADRVFGAGGGDRLLGRGGPDLLRGNAGRDVLKGNIGSDRLRGGKGFDRCRGGAGADSLRSCEG